VARRVDEAGAMSAESVASAPGVAGTAITMAASGRGFMLLAGGACALLVASSASAQQRAVDSSRFAPALDDEGFLTVQGTRTPGSELFDLGLFFSYALDELVVRTRDAGSLSVVEHRLTTNLSGQMGIGGRAAVAARVPLALVQTGYRVSSDDPELPVFAMGDPSLLARYRFLGDDADKEREHHDGPGIAAELAATLPAGRTDAYFGEGALRTDLKLLGDFHLLGAGAGAYLGWLHRFEPRTLLEAARFRDEIGMGLAFKMPLPWAPEVSGLLEARCATDAGAPFSEQATTSVETDLGARFDLGDAALTVSAGTGFVGVGAPTFRAVLGLWWSPRTHDADGDGIEDSSDQCPPLAEDKDGFQDRDGCPDPDNDGDWVPDADDLCPKQAAEENRDLNEDGCTDPP